MTFEQRDFWLWAVRPLVLCAFAAVVALVSSGCSVNEEAAPPRTPAQKPDGARKHKAVSRDTADEDRGQLAIDPRISKACDIPEAYFDFDSSAIVGEAAAVLDKLATCATTGPLAGRSLKLVGHADPRGETTYNFGLGQRRAGAVADYLESRGMQADHMASSSRGEIDATGVDEGSWKLDRKVEVLLGD
jgi:peptidoglycan-associated lipoprotein